MLFSKFLERSPALHGAFFGAGVDPVAPEIDAILASLLQGLFAGLAGGSLARLGKFHLGSLAVEIGEAERPHPFAAVAHHQIEAAAVGMRARLQGFNLI